MDHIDDEGRRSTRIVRLLADVVWAVPRLAALLMQALLYYVAPVALFARGRATGVSGTGGTAATSGRRFPARLVGRWAVTWAAFLALLVAVHTVGRAPFVGLLRWIGDVAAALLAHPTFAQTLAVLPATVALLILPLVVITVLAGPVLIPVLAVGHIAVAWLRGGGGKRWDVPCTG